MQVPIPEAMRAVDDARARAGGSISSPRGVSPLPLGQSAASRIRGHQDFRLAPEREGGECLGQSGELYGP